MAKILMFSGSARKESVNKKLILATAEIAKQLGAEVTIIDLANYSMPIYDGDIEEESGLPNNAEKLCKDIEVHDAIIIASPEYNGLPSPLLKNVIDWVSRAEGNVYSGKIAGIISASPGGLGGLRGLPHLRTLLSNLNMLVVPQQVAIGGAFKAFAEDGALKDERQQEMVKSLVEAIINVSKNIQNKR